MDKSKKKGITWGEAAKMVLERSSKPLGHKEILKAILDRKLKEVTLKFSQALACLNAMLHANSRTPTSLFKKIGGRNCCYILNKNRSDLRDPCSSDSDTDSPGSSSNDADPKEASNDRSKFPGISQSSNAGSLPPISSILGSYQSHGTSTSLSSSIACAIADSRLNSLIAPTPDSLPTRSALSKKRSGKTTDNASSSKKPRVTFKLDNEKKPKSNRSTRPNVKTKAELKYLGDDSNAVSQNFIPPVLRPPMYPTHTVVKNSSTGYFGQKRHKKMSIAAQVKRSKEGEVDLVSPDSLLSKINGRNLINFRTFNQLPKHYQYQLVKLLPEVDREVGSKGEIRPTTTAFSNEFFTSAFESWKERLSEGEFTPEMSQKIQQEQEKVFNQDPWKTKHFESHWGEKLLENERYVSPVERSHQIMVQVHDEWEKEQERLAKEKIENDKLKAQKELREAENTDLSAPNKLRKNEKNLTAKQKAALARQQKLAKAKSVTTKALKKTTEAKPTGKSGKNSSKNEKAAEKSRTKPIARTKQAKVSTGEDGQEVHNSDVVIDVVGIQNAEGRTSTDTDVNRTNPSAGEINAATIVEPMSASPRSLGNEEAKVNKKITKKKKETKVNAVSNTLGFPCMCVLKPMVMCRRCGAFCHSDCVSPMSICAACIA